MRRVLICANPDLNLIDGSSIWAQTITLAMAETGKAQLDFLAKSTPEREELFGPLRLHKKINIIDGTAKHFWAGKGFKRLQHRQMWELAIKLHTEKAYDIIVVRGYEIAQGFVQHPSVLAKCWIYLTDIPQSKGFFTPADRKNIAEIAEGACRILYQSQGFYELWREIVPNTPKEKFFLYSPVIPDLTENITQIDQRPLRAIYAGKFRGAWKTLEMAEQWHVIHQEIGEAELVMIGDKIHAEKSPPDYQQRMRNSLENTEGLTWLGGQSRERVQKELKNARVGLSWRTENMNDTLEYSTKILEYGGAGCAAILNRNPLHESLLGADYPLFANTDQEFLLKLKCSLSDPHLTQKAANRLGSLAQKHTFSHRVETLTQWLEQEPVRKKTILVAGHDLKFFGLLKNKLEKTGQYTFLIDKWEGHNKHDARQSEKLLEQADIIFCEWCLGNIKWYSHNKKDHQRLVARFHSQEKDLPYLKEADLNRIDHISFVSVYIKREGAAAFSIPESKTSVIANLMDYKKFTSSKKMGDACFTLGIIGITPSCKRVDLAIDTLELLLEQDDRYQLRIKGNHPFDYTWLRNRSDELLYNQKIMERINSSDKLRYKVIFDPPGDDVNQWLSLIGFILSPSDFESFHLAVGEGMLTGCVPVVWEWDGAAEIWPQESIVSTVVQAAQRISSMSDDQWQSNRMEARDYVLRRYCVNDIVAHWCNVLEGRDLII